MHRIAGDLGRRSVYVDDFGEWSPAHYVELCLVGGNRFYRENTRHWIQTSRRQRELYPSCCECGRRSTLDAHHLRSYLECAGAEVVGVDLETLCRSCHDDEHRSSRRRVA